MIRGIINGKCPRCAKGDLFLCKSIFPLKSVTRTVDNCNKCGQKIKGIDQAPGINYALTIIVYIIGFTVYAAIWGIRYEDDSLIYSFLFATMWVLLLQPWLMRLSKSIYIYLYIKSH